MKNKMMNFFRDRRSIIKYVLRNFSLSFFVIIFILVNTASAQFGEDVRVSDTTGGLFGCVEPWIVNGPDDILSIVWSSDYTAAFDFHLYFSKSTDMGNTWMPSVRIDDVGEACLNPCLAVDSSGNLYCVWLDIRMSGDEICFSKSTDGGNTWTPSVVVDGASASNCGAGEIIVNGNELLVVWADDRTGWRCYFSKSTDGGTTWTSGVKVSPEELSINPRIEAYGDTIYAAYTVYYSPKDIYLSRSTDNGSTWQVMGKINDVSSGEQRYHDIALTPDGIICCAWYDWRSGNCEIRFSKSADAGTSWIPSVVMSDTSWYQNPVLGEIKMNVACLDENRIYCVWQDFRYGAPWYFDIFFAKSEDGGTSWSDNFLVDDSANGYTQVVPSLCLDSSGNPCVVWGDERDLGGGICHIYFDKGEFSDIEEIATYSFIEDSNILQSYPNPFKEMTEIRWQISDVQMQDVRNKAQDISLKIYDVSGRIVKVFNLVSGILPLASSVCWDGHDNSNKQLPNGVYFCRLSVGDYQSTEKLLLVR